MLGTILKLFRPGYALTALILFGGWQGYSFIKSIPQKVSLPFNVFQIQNEQTKQTAENNQPAKNEAKTEQLSSNPIIAAIQKINPGMRIISWIIVYALLCFASVPVIKKMLSQESNLINAILVIIYSGLGLLLAILLSAFQFTKLTIAMLVIAVIFSAFFMIWLGGELEKMRVQDSFSAS